jgi:hypothetical protein
MEANLEQAKIDIKDLLLDIQDDPNIEVKLDKQLEKYNDYTTGELAEAVPKLEKTVVIQREGLNTMASLLIKKDEKLQVMEHSNNLMSKQLSVRDRDKISHDTGLFEDEVKKNKQRTKSRLYKECTEEYQRIRSITQ